jgi:hypothetical protein
LSPWMPWRHMGQQTPSCHPDPSVCPRNNPLLLCQNLFIMYGMCCWGLRSSGVLRSTGW